MTTYTYKETPEERDERILRAWEVARTKVNFPLLYKALVRLRKDSR